MTTLSGVQVQLDSSYGAASDVSADVTLYFNDGRPETTVCDVPVSIEEHGHTTQVYTAVVAMNSLARDAERRFQRVVVSLDAVPGNQVEGVSPLYHVINVDKADGMSAVVLLSCHLDAEGLEDVLNTLSEGQERAVNLKIVDMRGSDGASVDLGYTDTADSLSVSQDASVLAPWLDMDPDAKLGRDPVSYLLAFSPNSAQVGMLSEQWILGDVL